MGRTLTVELLNLTNTIPVSAVSTSEGYTNGLSTSASLTTLQGLGASKSFLPTTISSGQTSRLTIKVFNTRSASGPSPRLTGITFTDSLPAGVTVATPANATTNCSGGTVTATAGGGQVGLTGATIDADSSCLVQVDVTATTLGQYLNTIPQGTVTSTEGINSAVDATATLSVRSAPVITKAFSPSTVKTGVVSTLTVTLANSNAQAFTGAVLSDNLPTGLTIAPTPAASSTCTGATVTAP